MGRPALSGSFDFAIHAEGVNGCAQDDGFGGRAVKKQVPRFARNDRKKSKGKKSKSSKSKSSKSKSSKSKSTRAS
jgi:hypothetical protein